MKNKKKLIKSYLIRVEYFIKSDEIGDILIDYFTESDFNWFKGNSSIGIVDVKKIKRILVK